MKTYSQLKLFKKIYRQDNYRIMGLLEKVATDKVVNLLMKIIDTPIEKAAGFYQNRGANLQKPGKYFAHCLLSYVKKTQIRRLFVMLIRLQIITKQSVYGSSKTSRKN